ncbi:putative smad nuclear-interacting protein 1 [Penaeus vannamei]|uniref:Putative smad nuclear-interacting protein 1 n=1 Tax=Penaeus vannamei TaxID=6689 RepID=A0A3R7PMP7_PENVA|nr:putative smad nuclear-interacting protein 1 [Penaeus vannamei]
MGKSKREYREDEQYGDSSHTSDREEEHYHARRGSSRDRSEVRRSREDDRRGRERVEEEKAEKERKVKREERKNRERYENRQVKSRWDDDDEPQYDPNKSQTKRKGAVAENATAGDLLKTKVGEGIAEKDQGRSRQRMGGRVESRGNVEEARAGVKMNAEDNVQEEEEVQKPNMGLSGKLTEDTNTYNGVVIKYSQPPEARKPKRRWRWYIFKGEEDLPFLPLHRQSAYLIGRDRKVADIPTDHPSCSKQHAVLQYRLVTYNREDGTKGRTVKPYILDLESANGTYVNNRRIEPRRYVELLEKDVVKFGYSSREYILLHEGSKGEDQNAPDTGIDLSPVSLLRS